MVKPNPSTAMATTQKPRLWQMTARLAAYGIPPPQEEHQFAPPRRWRFDYAWPAVKVALELEGGHWTSGRHVRGKGYASDCEKYNTALKLGWRVWRLTWGQFERGDFLVAIGAMINEQPER